MIDMPMHKNPELMQLAATKQSKMRKMRRIMISMIYICAFVLVIYGIVRGQAQ